MIRQSMEAAILTHLLPRTQVRSSLMSPTFSQANVRSVTQKWRQASTCWALLFSIRRVSDPTAATSPNRVFSSKPLPFLVLETHPLFCSPNRGGRMLTSSFAWIECLKEFQSMSDFELKDSSWRTVRASRPYFHFVLTSSCPYACRLTSTCKYCKRMEVSGSCHPVRRASREE